MCFRAWIVAAVGLACVAGRAEAPAALNVELLRREAAPGEPLRVVVAAPSGTTSVEGSFADEPLFFVRENGHWAAWAVIDLDAKPGTRRLEVRAKGPGGLPLAASRTLRVVAKTFPEQRLKVADKYVEPSKEALARIEAEKKRLGEIYSRRTPAFFAAGAFARPVPGEPTSAFGLRRFFNGKPRSPHSGLDLVAATGTPVLASADGEIVLADDLYFSGKTVVLDHGGGLFTLYAHLSEIDVKAGNRATREQRLGLSGATGRVTGPHLHWGAKVGDRIFDPRALLDPRLFAENAPPR